MSQLFALIVAAAVSATVILLVTAGVAVLLRDRAAALHHALWTAAMGVSLSVPLLSVTLSALGVRNQYSASGFASAAWGRIAGPVPYPGLSAAVGTSAASVRSAATARTPFHMREIFGSAPLEVDRAAHIGQLLLLAWLAGLLLSVLRILRSRVAVVRLERSATAVSDVRIIAVWERVEKQHTSRKVFLVEADQITAPGAAGIVRPTIFLPRGAAGWGATRLHATLAHECAHVDRRDSLTHLLGDLAVAVYWFHPLAWYARRRMTTESERACDDRVLRGGVPPARYASVLLHTVRASLLQPQGAHAGIVSMARPSELEVRLLSVLDPSRSREGISSRGILATAFVAIVAAVFVSTPHLDAAPVERRTQSLVTTAEEVPPAPVLRGSGGEPDRRGDSIAGPMSERMELSAAIESAAKNPAALSGPDSVLARKLYAQLSRMPTWEGDLVGDRSAWALSRQRGGVLIEPLIESLADPDWRVRAYAAWALALSGDPRPVPPLITLLSHPNWRLRAMAAFAIDAIGDERAAAPMARAIGDEAWQVRVSAVHFIGSLHDTKYQSLLETALTDRHIVVREAASQAIHKPL